MSRDSDKIADVIMGRRPANIPSPGGATFVEGQVDHVDFDGLYFTVKSFGDGKLMFGPAPWPAAWVLPVTLAVTVGDSEVPTTVVDAHPAHGHATHHHNAVGSTTPATTSDDTVPTTGLAHDTHEHGTHSHPVDGPSTTHDHDPTLPAKGDRCLVCFPEGDNQTMEEPWVIMWWPA